MGHTISCIKKDKKAKKDETDGKITRANIYTAKEEGEIIEDKIVPEDEINLGEMNMSIDDKPETKEIATYCLSLLRVKFCGQTSNDAEGHTDSANVTEVLNLGLYLSLLDKFLRTKEVSDFTGDEEDYLQILRLVAAKRHGETEEAEDCYNRLLNDSRRFVRIYHKRGVKSEELHHEEYWGTRQQLLSAKVIGDWVDKENGPLDPLFAVLLQPTSGRVGPGDTGWIHNVLFDDKGHMAYHSAVHDAFGYLINFHNTGPGYDYMHNSRLATNNPMAGQRGGIAFWKRVLHEVGMKQKVIKSMRL